MRLKEIRLNHFGKFHNTTLELKDGINLIYGDNEAGKTTIHNFIKGMLFGIDKLRGRASKDDIYMKYQPWDTPGAYSGTLDIEVEGRNYRILRNFEKNTKSFTIVDTETGRELTIQPEELKELYGGLTEAGYHNTISIEQLKSRTDNELVEEVRNYITNLSLSKSNEIDIIEAINYLQRKKKEFEALQIDYKIAQLEIDIENGIARETKMDNLTMQLKEIEEQEKSLVSKREIINFGFTGTDGFATIEQFNACIEHFPAIKEKYKNYCDLRRQIKDLKEKQDNLQYGIGELEQIQIDNIHLKNEINNLDKVKMNLQMVEDNQRILGDNQNNVKIEKQKYMGICFTLSILSIIFDFTFLGLSNKNYFITTIIAFIIVIATGLLYNYLSKEIQEKLITIRNEYDNNQRTRILLQDKIRDILINTNTKDEYDLRNKYDIILRKSLTAERFQVELVSIQDQISSLNQKQNELQEQIQEYMRKFPGAFSNDNRETLARYEKENLSTEYNRENLSAEYNSKNLSREYTRENLSTEYNNKNLSKGYTRDNLSPEYHSVLSKNNESDMLNDSQFVRLEDYIFNKKEQIAYRQNEQAKEYENLIIKKEKVKWELDTLNGNESELLKNKELYKEYVQQQKENEIELAAIKLAMDTLNELSVDIHNGFGNELNQLVSELTNQVTQGKYEDVKIDERLNIKVGHDNNFVKLDKLSTGTIEQLFFVLRLGIADLIYGKGTMPILLDDCFAYYDDKRTKAALETLMKEESRQILLFTCHNREKTMLDQMDMEYNYIDLQAIS